MEKDMTKGSPIRLIASFCFPMFLGNIFQQIYNMTDAIIIGKFVSKEALAGVGSSGALNYMMIGCATAICSGLCIKISQAFGSKNFLLMRKYLANAIYLCIGFSIVLTMISISLTKWMFTILHTPQDIFEYAYTYIVIVFSGIIFIMIYNFLACVLRAIGDSKSPVCFLFIASFFNIILDLVFILGFKLGVKGAAYATVIAQGSSGVLCLIYMCRKYPILKMTKEEMAFDRHLCLSLISVGLPMGLQISITAVGSLVLQGAINALGTDTVAALTAYSKIETLAVQPLETVGIVMIAYCGQNRGAKEYYRIRQGIRKALMLSMAYCITVTVIICTMGSYLVLLFINKEEVEVIHYATKALLIEGLAYPLLSVLFLLRYALQGMGYSILPMLAGAAELFGRMLMVFGFAKLYGFTAVCLASPVAWLCAVILLFTTYVVKMRKLKIQLREKENQSILVA